MPCRVHQFRPEAGNKYAKRILRDGIDHSRCFPNAVKNTVRRNATTNNVRQIATGEGYHDFCVQRDDDVFRHSK